MLDAHALLLGVDIFLPDLELQVFHLPPRILSLAGVAQLIKQCVKRADRTVTLDECLQDKLPLPVQRALKADPDGRDFVEMQRIVRHANLLPAARYARHQARCMVSRSMIATLTLTLYHMPCE